MGVSGFLPDVCLWPAKLVFAGRRRCLLNQNRRMGLVSFFIRFPLLGGAADQFRPKTLHTAVRAAAADMVELSSTRCRIDEEVPVQFVLF